MTVLVNPPVERLGEENAVLSGVAREYRVRSFAGPLSIKSVRSGEAVWETSRGRFVLRPGAFLVVNDGQPYSMTIASSRPVETLCLFFRRELVEDVRRRFETPELALLDDPDGPAPPARFFEAARRDEAGLGPRLEGLRAALLAGAEDMALEARVLGAARALLEAERDAWSRMARLPARKASTREEVLRRVERGRAFLAAELGGRPTLERAARAACLSPFHFHRAFARAFGETPHRFVRRLRLERARRRLLATSLPVTEICREAGFQSLGSFVALFRRTFGAPPGRFRRAANSQD